MARVCGQPSGSTTCIPIETALQANRTASFSGTSMRLEFEAGCGNCLGHGGALVPQADPADPERRCVWSLGQIDCPAA